MITDARTCRHGDINRAVMNGVYFRGIIPSLFPSNLLSSIIYPIIQKFRSNSICNLIGTFSNLPPLTRFESCKWLTPAMFRPTFSTLVNPFVRWFSHLIVCSLQSGKRDLYSRHDSSGESLFPARYTITIPCTHPPPGVPPHEVCTATKHASRPQGVCRPSGYTHHDRAERPR